MVGRRRAFSGNATRRPCSLFRRTRRARLESSRGSSLIELLMSGLLLSIGLMGLVNVYAFSFNVTTSNDDTGIAYNLGRQTMETIRRYGWANVSNGTTTSYYTNGQALRSTATDARYTVTTTITTSSTYLKTAVVTVTLNSTGATLYQTSTDLSQGGI